MESQTTESFCTGATKAVTVSALSLIKKSVYKKEEKLQGKVITEGCLENMTGKDKSAKDNTPETRKTLRHIKAKKNTDFEYGDIKVTSCRVERTKKVVTSGSKVKGSENEKLDSAEEFTSRKKDVTRKALKRKSATDYQSEYKQNDIVETKIKKMNKGEKLKKSGKTNSAKPNLKLIGKTEDSVVSQDIHNTRKKRKTMLNKQRRDVKELHKINHDNSDENIEEFTSKSIKLEIDDQNSSEIDPDPEKLKDKTIEDMNRKKRDTVMKMTDQDNEDATEIESEVESDDIEHDFLKESHITVNTKHGKSRRKIYKCTYNGCAKEFTNEIYCQKHISKAHLILKFECEFCGLEFKQQELLSAHLKSIHAKEAPTSQFWKNTKSPARLKCTYEGCDKDFGHQSNLKKHINGVHLNIRNFHCEFCAFRFKSSSTLKNHIEVLHTKDAYKKLYECDVCKKAFPRKGSLKLHESLHTNIRPYVCTFEGCGKTFRQDSNLNKHKKVHTDEKPYQCFVCEERFTRKFYRDTHMYKHTGVKKYNCDICHKSFSQKGNMMTHKLLHSKDRPIYKCPECSQTFNFKSNMKKHLERHTTEDGFSDRRGSDKLGEDILGVARNIKSEASSQACSNDLKKIKAPVNKDILSNTDKKGELSPNKLWIAPTFLGSSQKSGKPIVFVVNSVTSPKKDKNQGKMFEQVDSSTSVSDVIGSKPKDARKISPRKIANQRSIPDLPSESINQSNLANDNSNIVNVEQGENSVMLDIESLDETQESVDEKVESYTRPPIYVNIEDITQDSNRSVKDQREPNDLKYSVDKLKSSVNKKPTFSIELNSDGLPVARLQEGKQSVSSDLCNYNLSSSEESANEMVVLEQKVTDVIEGSSSTNVEYRNQSDKSEQKMSKVTNGKDSFQMESPIQIDVSGQMGTGPNSSDEESTDQMNVLEQIVNVIQQVTNDTHEVVETTIEELIVNDSILQVSAENSDVFMDEGGSYSFPPSQ